MFVDERQQDAARIPALDALGRELSARGAALGSVELRPC